MIIFPPASTIQYLVEKLLAIEEYRKGKLHGSLKEIPDEKGIELLKVDVICNNFTKRDTILDDLETLQINNRRKKCTKQIFIMFSQNKNFWIL